MKTIYKSLVLTLLLICANTYAADLYYTINGSEDITFKKDAVIYVDFSQVSVDVTGFQIINMGSTAVDNSHLPTYVILTFPQNLTINSKTNNGAGFHWQENNNQWTHSSSEWAQFLQNGKRLPFPAKDSDCNCIRVTYDGTSAPTYIWISGYTPGGAGGGGGDPAPGPGPGPGGETGVGSGEISVSEATGNGTISEAADCEGCYKTTFVTK